MDKDSRFSVSAETYFRYDIIVAVPGCKYSLYCWGRYGGYAPCDCEQPQHGPSLHVQKPES